MKKILVGVDGSEASLKAAKWAVDLAAATGASVTFAYSIVPVVYPAEMMWVPTVEFERAQQEAAAKLLSQAREQTQRTGVAIETVTLHGPAAEAMADEAKAHAYDLLAVGSRGHGAVKRILMGSVASRLVHICERAVLVVR
ncbi:MAG: universal stress protein [Myxococcaceae bacterium]|nr:universal stress protein [Myxococcaceae bacterium]